MEHIKYIGNTSYYLFDNNDSPDTIRSLTHILTNIITTDNKVICAFDTETTSNLDKFYGCVYMYQFVLDDTAFIFRNYQQFISFLRCLDNVVEAIDSNLTVKFGVHNYTFDYYNTFGFTDIGERIYNNEFIVRTKILSARAFAHILFVDTLRLFNLSLDRAILEYAPNTVFNKLGNFDYTKKRYQETPLTADEIAYGLNDVFGLRDAISGMCERYNVDWHELKLTQTANARMEIIKNINASGKSEELARVLKKGYMTSEQYTRVRASFSGGMVYHNPIYSSKIVAYGKASQILKKRKIEHISVKNKMFAVDMTSAYPTTLALQKMPTGSNYDITPKVFTDYPLEKIEELLNLGMGFTASIIFERLKLKKGKSPIIRKIISNCINDSNKIEYDANGYLTYGDIVQVKAINDVTFGMIKHSYDFRLCFLHSGHAYNMAYVPKPFLMELLRLYKLKTELKGVEGKEDIYMKSKNIINGAVYGDLAMDIVFDDLEIDNNMDIHLSDKQTADIEKHMRKAYGSYNLYSLGLSKDKNTGKYIHNAAKMKRYGDKRWAAYVTAYTRNEMLLLRDTTGAQNTLYGDTDSHKGIELFNGYAANLVKIFNSEKEKAIEKAAKYHGISYADFAPIDSKGNVHPLGFLEQEDIGDIFITKGAKTYYFADSATGDYEFVNSGLSRKVIADKAIKDIKKMRLKPDIYNLANWFTAEHIIFDETETGKMTHKIGRNKGYGIDRHCDTPFVQLLFPAPGRIIDSTLRKVSILSDGTINSDWTFAEMAEMAKYMYVESGKTISGDGS